MIVVNRDLGDTTPTGATALTVQHAPTAQPTGFTTVVTVALEDFMLSTRSDRLIKSMNAELYGQAGYLRAIRTLVTSCGICRTRTDSDRTPVLKIYVCLMLSDALVDTVAHWLLAAGR